MGGIKMSDKFTSKEAIGFGWDVMKKNLKFFIPMLILIFFVTGLFSALGAKSGLINLAGFVVQVIIGMGMIKIGLGFCDGKEPSWNDFTEPLPHFFSYFFASILYFLILLAGTILLIVPGAIWCVKYVYFPYFIVEKGMGPVQSLKASAKLTYGSKWTLSKFFSWLVLLNLAGMVCLLVGLFATIPATMVATAWVYRKLSGLSADPVQSVADKIIS
jgi:uncharacterized membrane protein